jgi:O-antigen ligase
VQIWNYALESFLDRPFLGEGFGGWQVGFAKYALEHNIVRVFPPHNTFIYLWSQSGIVVVILAIFFILSIIQYAFKLLNSKNRELIGLGIALLGSFLWTFIHGMGTNFGLVGESHMEVILATILGYSYARFKISKDKNEK